MTIRPATDTDLPMLVDIYNASVPGRMATADTEPVSVNSRRAWFDEHTHNLRRPLLVMCADDGQIAGWLSFSDYPNARPGYAATAEMSCYVSPAFQGQGVGKTLMADATRRAPSLGLTTLVSFVFAHNVPSLRMCERLGYERWGLLPGIAEMDGVRRDVVILGLKVTP